MVWQNKQEIVAMNDCVSPRELNLRLLKRILSSIANGNSCINQHDWETGLDALLKVLQYGAEAAQRRALVVLGRVAKQIPSDILRQVLPSVISLLSRSPSSSFSPTVQETAAFCLGKVAFKGDNLSALIGESGVIVVLLRLSQETSGSIQKVSIKTLRQLVICTKSNQIIMSRNGGTEAVVQLMFSGPEDSKVHLAEILSSLATLKEVRRALVIMGGIQMLIQSSRMGKIASRTRAAHAIGLMSVAKRVRRALVNAGAIPALIDLLREDDLNAKLTAANSIGILSAHVDYLRPVAEAGAIPLFVELLQGSDALGKEIAEDVFSILAVAEDNAVAIAEHLVRILESSNSEAKAAAADVIWDLSSYKHSIAVVRSSGAIPLLVRALEQESEDVREKASGAIAQLSYDKYDRLALVEAGAIPVLLFLLQNDSEELKDNASEALINFSEDPSLRDLIADAFNVPAFHDIQERLLRIRQSDSHMVRSLRFMSLEQFTS